MHDETLHQQRLLREIEHATRLVNREVINPLIQELTSDDLLPLMAVVAKARGKYLAAMFRMTAESRDHVLTAEQVKELRDLRETYEEILAGARALETAIARGYLDVKWKAMGGDD